MKRSGTQKCICALTGIWPRALRARSILFSQKKCPQCRGRIIFRINMGPLNALLKPFTLCPYCTQSILPSAQAAHVETCLRRPCSFADCMQLGAHHCDYKQKEAIEVALYQSRLKEKKAQRQQEKAQRHREKLQQQLRDIDAKAPLQPLLEGIIYFIFKNIHALFLKICKGYNMQGYILYLKLGR